VSPQSRNDPLRSGSTLLALSGLLLGLFLAGLNQTAVVSALPQMVADLGNVSNYSWVFTTYMLTSTVTVPIWGRLSDIYGRRPLFLIAVITFQVGAIVAITAGTMTQLVVARAVQGLGGGALIGLALTSIGDLVPPSDRGRIHGVVGAISGGAVVLGPAIGGWIVDNTTWRWVFVPALPLGVLALATTMSTLEIPRHQNGKQSVDLTGALLLSAGLASGMLVLVLGGKSYPWSSFQITLLLAGSVVTLFGFGWHVNRVDDPIIPLHLLHERVFSAASTTMFLIGAAMFSTFMFVPLFVQGAQGESATKSGMVIAPMLLAMIISSVISGQVISRRGRYRGVLLGGPVLMMAGFALLFSLDVHSPMSHTTQATIVMGFGLGLLSQNLVLVMQNAASPGNLGVTTGSAQFFRGLGGTIGVTVLGAILSSRLDEASRVTTLGDALADAAGASLQAREAIANAIHPLFAIGIASMGAALVTTLLIPHKPLRGNAQESGGRTDLTRKP
jgi:EmrB/QacA subfamily drug resistance transporter